MRQPPLRAAALAFAVCACCEAAGRASPAEENRPAEENKSDEEKK